MPPASTRSQVLAGLVCLVLGSTLLTSCGAQTEASDYELTVPVLWASGDQPGATGGIENATVAVGHDSVPGFSVDLSDPTAKGTGPQWLAASGTAAAVGTLYSGVNPAEVGIRFAVTGAIDGLSGGAMLTVGVIAALNRMPLQSGVTMTGALLPDGQILEVGAIPTKIRVAAEEGYSTVLIPKANLLAATGSGGKPMNMSTYGHQLGVTVTPVTDLLQAYRLLVGQDLVAPVAEMPPLPPGVTTESRQTASALLTRCVELERTLDGQLSVSESSNLAADLRQARQAIRAGDFVGSYATSSIAYRELVEIQSQNRTQTQIIRLGLPRTRASIEAKAKRVDLQAQDLAESASNIPSLAESQQLMMASALSQLTGARAILDRVQRTVSAAPASAPRVVSAAVALDQAEATTNVFVPGLVAIVESSGQPETSAPSIAGFMSGYTNFLTQAGDANFAIVGEFAEGSDRQRVADDAAALALELQGQAREIPKDDQALGDEIQQMATAMAYFTMSVALPTLADAQLYGSSTFTETSSRPRGDAASAVRAASSIARPVVAEVARDGYDAGLCNWQTRVTMATVDRSARADSTNSAIRSVVPAWDSVISAFAVRSLVRSGARL